MSSNSMYNPPYPNPPITPTEKAPFGITDVQRTSSFSGSEPQVKDSSRVSESTKVPCVQDTTSSSSTKRFVLIFFIIYHCSIYSLHLHSNFLYWDYFRNNSGLLTDSVPKFCYQYELIDNIYFFYLDDFKFVN